MEKKTDKSFSFYVTLALFLGFLIGLVFGIKSMKSECDKWSEMYDRHINEQWRMIQKRDSLYSNAIKQGMEYMNGHIVEPQK